MALSPVLTSKVIEPNQAQFTLKIPSDLFYLASQLPEHPIVLGVVLIHWVTEFAQTLVEKNTESQLEKIKFMRPVLPNMEVQLEIRIDKQKRRIVFKYSDSSGNLSTGQFNYD